MQENVNIVDVSKFEDAALRAVKSCDFFMANSVVNKIFAVDPENSIAHYCKLLSYYKATNVYELNPQTEWEQNALFVRAIRCSDMRTLPILKQYLEDLPKERLYRKSIENFETLYPYDIEQLEKISDYRDVAELLEKKRMHKELAETIGSPFDYFIPRMKKEGVKNVDECISLHKISHMLKPFPGAGLFVLVVTVIMFILATNLMATDGEYSPLIYAYGALFGVFFMSLFEFSSFCMFGAYSYMMDNKTGTIASVVSGAILAKIIMFGATATFPEEIVCNFFVKVAVVAVIIQVMHLLYNIYSYQKDKRLRKIFSPVSDYYKSMRAELENKYLPYMSEDAFNKIVPRYFYEVLNSK